MNSLCRLSLIWILASSAWSISTRWEVGQYGKCSESCGRGVQRRSVSCKEITRDISVPERICPPPKPMSTRSCAIVACAPEWSTVEWKECSKTCGRGFQYRELLCSQRLANGATATVSDDYCPRGRPPTRRKCAVIDCPPRYSAKKWTKCSASCGGGAQLRQVQCTHIKAGAHVTQVVATDHCSHLVAPHRKRRCNHNECPVFAHAMAGRNRIAKPRTVDGATYFRKRRTYRIRPALDLRARPQVHIDRNTDSFMRRRQHMLLNRKRLSRRRSISVEKALFNRCENILRNGLNSSHVESDLLLPCLLQHRASNDALVPAGPDYQAVAPTQPEPQRLYTTKYSMPYIVTQTDISPSPFSGDIVTYVGGTLTVSDSDTVTLLCEASGFPLPTTKWLKDGGRLVENERRVILPDRSLRLIRPLRSDGGIYTCVASNAVGSFSAKTTLNVATRPRILSLEEHDIDHKAPEIDTQIGSVIRARTGVAIRISCPVEGFPPPRIRWEKDVAGLGENARILPDNSLEIYPVTPVDQGLYNCEATNPIGTDYRTSTLLLFEAPHLQEFLSQADAPARIQRGLPRLLMAKEERPIYKLDHRGSALMGCPVAGQVQHEIKWKYKNRPIDESSYEIKFHILVDGMVLFLENVNASSTGVYSCYSHNDAGNFTASLELSLASYSFIPGGLGLCSHSCGGSGVQHVSMNCIREGNEVVAEWHCSELKKTAFQTLACNRIDCPPKYHVEAWGTCSKTCGMGERSRKVSCRVLQSDNNYLEVGKSLCANQLSPGFEWDVDMIKNAVPASQKICSLSACPMWKTGSWSQCGEKCYGLGMGIRVRRLHCLNVNGTSVSRLECPHSTRPKWRELCFTRRCDPVWVVSKWSTCSRTCGNDGIQTRILNCVFRGNRRQRARNLCDNALRPHVSMACGRMPC